MPARKVTWSASPGECLSLFFFFFFCIVPIPCKLGPSVLPTFGPCAFAFENIVAGIIIMVRHQSGVHLVETKQLSNLPSKPFDPAATSRRLYPPRSSSVPRVHHFSLVLCLCSPGFAFVHPETKSLCKVPATVLCNHAQTDFVLGVIHHHHHRQLPPSVVGGCVAVYRRLPLLASVDYGVCIEPIDGPFGDMLHVTPNVQHPSLETDERPSDKQLTHPCSCPRKPATRRPGYRPRLVNCLDLDVFFY